MESKFDTRLERLKRTEAKWMGDHMESDAAQIDTFMRARGLELNTIIQAVTSPVFKRFHVLRALARMPQTKKLRIHSSLQEGIE